jgi:hypothetical protein
MKSPAYLPSRRGFDRFYGYYCGIMDYWKHYEDEHSNGHIGLDLHEGGVALGHAPGKDVPVYHTAGQYSTRLFAKVAAGWISGYGAQVTASNSRRSNGTDESVAVAPFFLYLAFQGVHSSNNKFVQAPEATIAAFDSISPTETCGQYAAVLMGQCTKAAMRKTVAAAVAEVDQGIGLVVGAVDRHALFATNSLIVVSADNGGPTDGADSNMMNNFPLRGCKGGYFEGGVRAVGLLAGVGLQKTGYVNRRMHHVADWLPTLLAAATPGATAPSLSSSAWAASTEPRWLPGDGLNNWAALSRDAPSARTEIIHVTQADGSLLSSHAVRSGDLKLLRHPAQSDCSSSHAGLYPPPGLLWNSSRSLSVDCGGPPPQRSEGDLLRECNASSPCLFNVTADPCEFHDLAAALPAQVQRLRARLATYAAHTVLPWENFRRYDERSDPIYHGPNVTMSPDPRSDGPHVYQGLWAPWLTDEEERRFYPTNYTHRSRDV